MPKNPAAACGATTNPALLETLTIENFELLPGCLLNVKVEHLADGEVFNAALAPECHCCFNYAGEVREVSLGFKTSKDEFLSYDKGIDSTTGKALWGAILGSFRFIKCSKMFTHSQ